MQSLCQIAAEHRHVNDIRAFGAQYAPIRALVSRSSRVQAMQAMWSFMVCIAKLTGHNYNQRARRSDLPDRTVPEWPFSEAAS